MVGRPNPDSNHPPERYYDHRSGRMRRTGQERLTPRSPHLRPLPPSARSRRRGIGGCFTTLVLALLIGLGGYAMYEAGYLDRLALAPASPASAPIGTAIAVLTPMPTIGSLPEAREYMLEQINRERAKAGLNPVELGSNRAAQIHAEATLEGCFGSHWGLDGLKPYMRYSLAGGYQSNSENWHGNSGTVTRGARQWSGLDYCLERSDGGFPHPFEEGSIARLIVQAMEGWMNSPGHRANILDRLNKRVNIGLAWNGFNFSAIQHFEGDYVVYDRLPSLVDGEIAMSGSLTNGATLNEPGDLGVQIYYDPPPQPLTRGQLVLTSCYGSGVRVASLRPPSGDNRQYVDDEYWTTLGGCLDPYDVPADAPAPTSLEEESDIKRAARAVPQAPAQVITAPWITATEWNISGQKFTVSANIEDVVRRHGPGVYTVILWSQFGGNDEPVSEYSIFYGVEPPDTYSR